MHSSEKKVSSLPSSRTKTTGSKLSMDLLGEDQQNAITRLVEHDETLLIAGMGAGKTVIALSAIAELLETGVLTRVLVIAPLRVCNHVWRYEADLWDHLSGLNVAVATGTPAKRRAAFDSTANVVVVNVENVAWMVDAKLHLLFNGLCCDESSRLKSTGTKAVKKLRHVVKHFDWKVCMSGTPVAEGLIDLYAQMLMLGANGVLARTKQLYLDRFFVPLDFDRHQWEPRKTAAADIAKLSSPYVHVMPDYTHTLPPLSVTTVDVIMPDAAMREYHRLGRDMVLDDVTAANRAVLQGKLQQIAAGFVYTDDEPKTARTIHIAKTLALAEWLADCRAAGETGLVVYSWDWQKWALRDLDIPLLGDDNDLYTHWNNRAVPFLGIHPKSAAHGLNLQRGGWRMLFLSPVWSLDLHDQTIARLWRRGQTMPVRVDVLVSVGTVDHVVMFGLNGKETAAREFLEHLEGL